MADIYIGNVKGPQGVQGETGEQGVPGEAATIEVGTVSTTAYGNTAQVTNTGTSSAAVFDFVIPQGRPGEETTTMSSLTLDTVTAQSAQYPVPATGESGSVVFGKIIKFFNDVKSAIVNKINYSDCVYNLTSDSNTLPLAASQGKALNDALAAQAVFTPVAPSEWAGNWDNVYSQPLTIYRFVVMTAEYNGQVMVQQMYPSAMLSGKSMYLAYQDPSWNGRVKFTFNNELTRCTVSNFTNFTKVKLFGIK